MPYSMLNALERGILSDHFLVHLLAIVHQYQTVSLSDKISCTNQPVLHDTANKSVSMSSIRMTPLTC